jgi:hypothetical protein
MIFTKINEGGVVGNGGVVIQVKHPDYLEYREGEWVADVSIGYDPSSKKIHVYASQLDFWKKNKNVKPMSESKKVEIAKNLKNALVLLKGNYVVE